MGFTTEAPDAARGVDSRLFQLIFEHSPTAQAVITPGVDRRVVANPALATMFGTTVGAFNDVVPLSLIHEEDQRALAEAMIRLGTGEARRITTEARLLRTDGSMFHGHIAATALHDADGEFESLLVTIEDVSAQIEAAAALAKSEARARALVENSPDVIAILYPDGDWEASEQGTRLMGYPKGEDIPGGLMGLIHPDDMAKATEALAELVAGTRDPHDPLEMRMRAAWGEYKEFECVGRNLEGDADIQGIVITARDVTARKRAEARLRAAEQRFQVAFEHAPVTISIVDLDGRIVDVNPAACAALGRTAEELIGSPAADSVHPDDRERAQIDTMAQLAGSSTPVEFRLESADGEAITVLSHAAFVNGPNDEAGHVLTLQTDISHRKRLEAELERRALHDDLTGLPNRAALSQYLEYAFRQRTSRPRAALFIDLDNFKTVNDQFGHAAGDDVLVHVAEQLRAHVREGDIAARVGGDEFVVVCELDAPEQAYGVAERIRLALTQCIEDSLPTIGVSASVGVALAHPDDEPQMLIRRADTAAYIAKRSGKSRSEILGAVT